MRKIWLRAESKPFEQRSVLAPKDAAQLVAAGFEVHVERWPDRCFADEAFVAAGCVLEATGSWQLAPDNAVVMGLKALPSAARLNHQHIYFAHCFKEQDGWRQLMTRFRDDGGRIRDLEFLTDDRGARVAAFGYWAGYTGAALAVSLWATQVLGQAAPAARPWRSQEALIGDLSAAVRRACAHGAERPSALVVGALGRSGRGAARLLQQLDLVVVEWDLAETASGGPFETMLEHELLLNCVFVSGPMRPFTTWETLRQPRRLRVISDVSCDPNSPHNPLPIYSATTTLAQPMFDVASTGGLAEPLWLTAIDHLPTLLPGDASLDFSASLLPHLLELPMSPVWERADAAYDVVLARL